MSGGRGTDREERAGDGVGDNKKHCDTDQRGEDGRDNSERETDEEQAEVVRDRVRL